MKKCFALLTLVFSIFLPSNLIAQSGAIDELDSVSVPGNIGSSDEDCPLLGCVIP